MAVGPMKKNETSFTVIFKSHKSLKTHYYSGADADVVKVVISQGQKSEIIFILSESIAKQLVL